MAEIKALKEEKGDTQEARKMAEEQIEIMKKDHEEKVLTFFFFFLLLSIVADFFVLIEYSTLYT